MIRTIKKAATRYTWLFLTAAWLYTLSFIFSNYFSESSSPDKAANTIEKYLHTQEDVFEQIASDTALLHALVSDEPSIYKQNLFNDGMGLFAYQVNDIGNPVLVFWNNNILQPDTKELQKPDGTWMSNTLNGHFECIKKSFRHEDLQWFIYAAIPVKWEYFLTNEYLESRFAVESNLDNNYQIQYQKGDATVKSKNGTRLFYLDRKNNINAESTGAVSIFFRFLAVLLFFLFFYFKKKLK